MKHLADVRTEFIAIDHSFTHGSRQLTFSNVSLEHLLERIRDYFPNLDIDEEYLHDNYQTLRGGTLRFIGIEHGLDIELKEVHYLKGLTSELEAEFGNRWEWGKVISAEKVEEMLIQRV